ncbi:Acetoin catabolism regulatory protein [compost metagenome]
MQSGGFREDLFYRLNGLVLDLPPLRERSDKPELLQYLLGEEARGEHIQLADDACQALLDYHWPGNVRQLRNVLRTLAALCEDGVVRLADLPRDVLRASPASTAVETPANPLDDAERSALLNALDSQRWHMTRTAEQLGISRNTLYRKLRKHAIATRG